MIDLVKYTNRKTYCPSGSCYVTAGDLVEWIRQGKEVTIRDHRTKNDITKDCLLQLLPKFAKLSLDETINLLLNKGNK